MLELFNSQETKKYTKRSFDYDMAIVIDGVPDMGHIEHAYATTIHKSQGSEYGVVIIPVIRAHAIMLKRNLIYTAITRARELLIIVGREETVGVMVENARKNRRYSGLKLRLQGKCQ